MIIERTKALYAKFIKGNEISYVPVYLWQLINGAIVGCVPEFPPGAEILPVTNQDIIDVYGDFEAYVDESQFIVESEEPDGMTVYIYP